MRTDAEQPLEISESLIRASQKGDRNAFETLLTLVYDIILRFAMLWVDHISDAEDITQQVCVRLARVIKQFRFESAFSTWLYRIVLNCSRDWHRKQSRHRSTPDESVPSERAYKPSEAQIELRQVLSQVETMGRDFKETLLLVYARGFSHAQTAEILGVKESTVSWRLHQIRKRLGDNQASGDEARENKI